MPDAAAQCCADLLHRSVRYLGHGPETAYSWCTSFIGRQEWLDRPSYRFEHMLSYAFNVLGGARDRVTNALNGVWLGLRPPGLSRAQRGGHYAYIGLELIQVLTLAAGGILLLSS
jgi:hypothetical protein